MADRLEDLETLLDDYKRKDGLINTDFGIYNSYFIITNIETLRNEKIIQKLKELCDEGIINMIALDERSSL